MRKFWLRDLWCSFTYKFSRGTYKDRRTNSNREHHSIKGFVIILVVMSISYLSLSFFEIKVKPIILSMAESRAKSIALRAINEGVLEEIVGKVTYQDLITIRTDGVSKVTALQTNVVKLNEIQASTTYVVQEKIADIDSSELKIPIGTLFKSTLLAGRGPKINVKVLTLGSVQSNFANQFESAGINQTKHKISLNIKSNIVVILPIMQTVTKVETSIPVAETIIVGDVPATYLDARNTSEEARDIAENLTSK